MSTGVLSTEYYGVLSTGVLRVFEYMLPGTRYRRYSMSGVKKNILLLPVVPVREDYTSALL
jgi:hypothetical protein